MDKTITTPPTHPPLGELLLQEALITPAQLEEALALQQQTGGKLGTILTHTGQVPPRDCYRTLAEQQQLPLIDLVSHPPHATALHQAHIPLYMQHETLPHHHDGERWHLATTHPAHITPALLAEMGINSPSPPCIMLTTPYDIRRAIATHFATPLTHDASFKLLQEQPHDATHPIRTHSPRIPLLMLAGIIIALWGWQHPHSLWHSICTLLLCFFTLMLCFKMALLLVGAYVRRRIFAIGDSVPLLNNDQDLPIYTILVPLFREASSVPDMLRALNALDYPPHKLDIKLIIEAEDSATRDAIIAAQPDGRYHLITVPYGTPQTKPRACNYALRFARGTYLTIYDAEDAPAPLQLRCAASIFHAHPDIACLQARLNYYNAKENWLTSLFALEYAGLFDLMLPALYALHIPIPLGGTSNHLRYNALETHGAWDAFNVTEDADLGIRLASKGLRTLPISSLTLEEAPLSPHAWLKQRTRWIKGYLQTWRVMCRQHRNKSKQWRMIGYIGAHSFIGLATMGYILSLPALCFFALSFVAPSWLAPLPFWLDRASFLLLLTTLLMQWTSAFLIYPRAPIRPAASSILLYPFYFLLHGVAGLRAIWHLMIAPYHWEKTTHHVTNISRFEGNRQEQ